MEVSFFPPRSIIPFPFDIDHYNRIARPETTVFTVITVFHRLSVNRRGYTLNAREGQSVRVDSSPGRTTFHVKHAFHVKFKFL